MPYLLVLSDTCRLYLKRFLVYETPGECRFTQRKVGHTWINKNTVGYFIIIIMYTKSQDPLNLCKFC